jgi:hypothetical protein
MTQSPVPSVDRAIEFLCAYGRARFGDEWQPADCDGCLTWEQLKEFADVWLYIIGDDHARGNAIRERLDPTHRLRVVQFVEGLMGAEFDPQSETRIGCPLEDQLYEVFETLSEREAGTVRLRDGLHNGLDGGRYSPGWRLTYEDIGDRYGFSRQTASMIYHKAMQKLRHPSRSQVLRPYMQED